MAEEEPKTALATNKVESNALMFMVYPCSMCLKFSCFDRGEDTLGICGKNALNVERKRKAAPLFRGGETGCWFSFTSLSKLDGLLVALDDARLDRVIFK
jgi:hypothetical protein